MALALLVPFTMFIGFAYAACESGWRRWRKTRPATRSDAHRADTDAVIEAETVVHAAYDTWYEAPDHSDVLRRLPTP